MPISQEGALKVKVQKFGGSSLSSLKHIRRCVSIVERAVSEGFSVVVVVSAMGSYTDSLVDYIEAFDVQDNDSSDVVLSAGEQVSCGLFTLALGEIGIKAISLMGWQLPIETDGFHSKARIRSVCVEKILDYINQKYVVVVAGFQGVYLGRLTTLGRGGSDITATALAKSLNAISCEIYTDVEGVFSTDPRAHAKEAEHLPQIGYSQLLEMSLKEKVLHSRALDIARKGVSNILIKSSFEPSTSVQTKIVDNIEELQIFGLTFSEERVMIDAEKQCLLTFLEQSLIEVESISVIGSNASAILEVSEYRKIDLPAGFKCTPNLTLITIVGSSFLTEFENLNKVLGVLESADVKYLITTEIKIVIGLPDESFVHVKKNIINTLRQISYSNTEFTQIENVS
ncbi:aspartate kinase domain protein [Neorickettsia helminthoeca str. Oregon]|uniref:aspartate kinase n=1 Tax=Neorickettsia helminthoeca str. Oregon TaxID=1286528 RepID=X5H2Z9_9RICK|nr:hypothetical protein [Neorickettsia helminthoeca]AHX11033.1 aspartate kinase domain protein [Neorickettsia helminthoeca str. Oregon]